MVFRAPTGSGVARLTMRRLPTPSPRLSWPRARGRSPLRFSNSTCGKPQLPNSQANASGSWYPRQNWSWPPTRWQNYELLLQLVRLEVRVIEAAQHWQVDRGLIMGIRTLGKEGGRQALDRPLWTLCGQPRPAPSRSSSSRPPRVRGRRRSPRQA